MLIVILMLLGIVLGLFMPVNIPASFTPFAAMGLMAACNTLFGGIAAEVKGKFDSRTFVIGLFSNAVFATLLTFLGAKLGVDFSIAAIVYFGTRIFNNLAKIQHSILQKKPKRGTIEKVITSGVAENLSMHTTFSSDEEDD